MPRLLCVLLVIGIALVGVGRVPVARAQPACDPTSPSGCPLSLGQPVSGDFATKLDSHLWQFQLPIDTEVEVRLSNLGVPLRLVVLPVPMPDGAAPIVAIDEPTLDDRVAIPFLVAGRYAIEVANLGQQSHPQPYTLIVISLQPLPTPTVPPTPTAQPTATAAPPTVTPEPTVTAVPPTATPIPPTATTVPPTASPEPTAASPPATVAPTVPPAAGLQPRFGSITFTRVDQRSFSYSVPFSGMRNGVRWGYVLNIAGSDEIDTRDQFVWNQGEGGILSGTITPTRSATGGGAHVPHVLTIFVEGREVARGTFTALTSWPRFPDT